MNLMVNNSVEKKVQAVARRTRRIHADHPTEMRKIDREVRSRRAKQEDYSELIGQQVLA